MAKSALITGVNGQDGSYLAELLLGKGYEVHGTYRRSSCFNTVRIDHLLKKAGGRLRLYFADMTDGCSLRRAVGEARPDEVYNLAGQSHVGVSFSVPEYTIDTNGMGCVRLLEAVREAKPDARFYQASTGEMYGNSPVLPLTEETPFGPCSPYGHGKLLGYYHALTCREAYDMFVCNGILINHESPRRKDTFVTRKITRAATRIKVGLQDELAMGITESRRDWGFAGDYVEAMWLMLQQDKPDDYLICTGVTHSVADLLDEAFSYVGLDWHDHVVKDPQYYRPVELMEVSGDPTKAMTKLGWKPKHTFKDVVAMMMDADMELARREKLIAEDGSHSDAMP